MTIKFNACPKCQGDLQLKRDLYGMFINCLQCGLQKDLDAPTAAVELAKAKGISTRQRATKGLLRAA